MDMPLHESVSVAVNSGPRLTPIIAVRSEVKWKALDPLSSTCPPNRAKVSEWSPKGIMLSSNRFVAAGTVVQLHHEQESSIWKVLCCLRFGSSYQIGLEFKELVDSR